MKKCPKCFRTTITVLEGNEFVRATAQCVGCGYYAHLEEFEVSSPSTVQFKPTERFRSMLRARRSAPPDLDLSTPEAVASAERAFRDVLAQWQQHPATPFREAAVDGMISALFRAIGAHTCPPPAVPPENESFNSSVARRLEDLAKRLRYREITALNDNVSQLRGHVPGITYTINYEEKR